MCMSLNGSTTKDPVRALSHDVSLQPFQWRISPPWPLVLLSSHTAGLRGAIPYALSLHLGLEPLEKRQLIGTTTIIIVLFTILILGGGTMPLIRLMDIEESQTRRKSKKDVTLSKTEKMVRNGAARGFSGRCGGLTHPQARARARTHTAIHSRRHARTHTLTHMLTDSHTH